MNYTEAFLNKMNKINLTGCEGVNVGDTLYYVYSNRSKKLFWAFLIGLKKIIFTLLFETVEFQKLGDPDTLFLFSNSYRERKDLKKSFDRVVGLADNYVYFQPFYGTKIKLSNLHYLHYIAVWCKQLKKDLPSFFDRMYYSAFLLEAVYAYDLINRFISAESKDLKKLVCLCDVHMIDCFFVQKFNSFGKVTITLQHGSMCSTTNTWAFLGSHSDYFIANSEFTVSEAELLDYGGKMIVGGLYSFVDNQPEIKPICKEINSIGVLVDGDALRADNFRTIETMAAYCDKYRKKLLVKLHPSCNSHIYENEFGKCQNILFYKKELSLNQFFDLVDVAVIRNSTTLIEALQYGIPCYIINDSLQMIDVYKNVRMLKFSNEEDFHVIVDERSIDEIKRELLHARAYFGCFDNVTEKYKQIFSELGIKLCK